MILIYLVVIILYFVLLSYEDPTATIDRLVNEFEVGRAEAMIKWLSNNALVD